MSRKDTDILLHGGGLFGESQGEVKAGGLAQKFMIPPLTVLNAREGWWQERKRAWLSLGIQSELGRGGGDPMAEETQQSSAPAPPVITVSNPPPGLPEQAPAPKLSPPIVVLAQPAKSPIPPLTTTFTGEPSQGGKSLKRPLITGGSKPKETAAPKQTYLEPPFVEEAKAHGDTRIVFEGWDDKAKSGGAVGCDVECYRNFFLVCFKRFNNGQKISFELSDRDTLDTVKLRYIMETECIVTFNGMAYDLPMIYLALAGKSTEQLKEASDRIIKGGLKWWDVERELGVKVPKINHVDLSGSNPSVRQSLKTLGGRLHAPLLMDLPYDEDMWLSHHQMNVATLYCVNDIDHTQIAFNALREPLQLRMALSKQYGVDMRSKSDAQVGEAIIKKRVEQITGKVLRKGGMPDSSSFNYDVPSFVTFESNVMQQILAKLKLARFSVDGYERIHAPELGELQVRLGDMLYSMGIGGLHSTEENRAVASDAQNVLVDMDVASQYPSIIAKLGLFPPAVGPAFLEVYGGMLKERLEAKILLKAAQDKVERSRLQVQVEGSKIALNGVYGKLGSPYSFLYAPNLLVATTITGQLSLLMLIEQAELAGIPVVSANTDGIVFKCPRSKEADLQGIINRWEEQTGFVAEVGHFKAIYSSSVNTYMAIKDDGKVKRKGPPANPWKDNDLRGQMSKNPQMTVCSEAVLAYAVAGTPFEETIRACKDVRDFITLNKVTGGCTWRKNPLGRVVRYYWSTDGDPIVSTSNRKVAKTDGAKPLMRLPEELPSDIDYGRYVLEAQKLAEDMAVVGRKGML